MMVVVVAVVMMVMVDVRDIRFGTPNEGLMSHLVLGLRVDRVVRSFR